MDKFALDIRNQNALDHAFEQADNLLMKRYIANLADYEVVPLSSQLREAKVSEFSRLFKISRLVYDKDENNQDKLLNIYNSLYSCGGSVVLILESDGTTVDFYIGTKAPKGKVAPCQAVLSKALQGNYPGTRYEQLRNPEMEVVMSHLFETGYETAKKSVSAVSGISSFRTEKEKGNLGFIQGIEKVMDSMRGEAYAMIIVADPIDQAQIDTITSGYEALYTQLVPFATTELNFSKSESSAITKSLTEGVSNSISENLSRTHTSSEGSSKSRTLSKQTGGNFGFSFILNLGRSSSKSVTNGGTENWNQSDGESSSTGTGNTTSRQDGTSDTATDGSTKSLQIKMENKPVKVLLDKIDEQLHRLHECNDLGMWNCSTYMIADDNQTSKVLASTYQALMRGEHSGTESSAVTTWTDPHKLSVVSEYLQKLYHPVIEINPAQPLISPASLVSGKELTIAAGLPQKSIPGVAVYEFTPFGREIVTHEEKSGPGIAIGNVHHMGIDDNLRIRIDCQSLASHTFITGSTGAGKSNAIYKIIEELGGKGIPFLVVEPSKGEYKHVFGNRENVAVYGTNPSKTPMLRINPFKFPEDIHVLEHIDRLIEIFNVCWPMYAAMPAVLKDAVERAYQSAGWDLDRSVNRYDNSFFPCFIDVLEQLHRVIGESEFSEEVKSNYIGALVTRIRSLTNGINGQVFTADELDNHQLFDLNTIIDLSRVSSNETKAMLMGILVMKLQEHRISEGGMNKPLRHVTVLEEAHHLLKRTSMEQSSEGSNLIGKSVEMLANSIAEMRTYGEGFIIADQSPNMLDLSVIRNTNTKIILRLPDVADRELVGKAAGLNDSQIVELAKLSTGIGAIYQNDWLEPVLCHMDKTESPDREYRYTPQAVSVPGTRLKATLLRCLLGALVKETVSYNFEDLKERIVRAPFSVSTKLLLIKSLQSEQANDVAAVSKAVSGLFNMEQVASADARKLSVEEWNQQMASSLGLDGLGLDSAYKSVIIQCLLREKSAANREFADVYEKWTEHMRRNMI